MWYSFRPEIAEAMAELQTASDRTTCIVATTIVESYLTDALRKDLLPDDTKDSQEIQDNTFQPEGVLGNLGAKIKLAYLMGYFSHTAYKDIHNMKYIRNRFAHYTEANSFNKPNIKDRCANFVLIRSRVRKPTAWQSNVDGSDKKYFDSMSVDQNAVFLNLADYENVLKHPKERFIATAKLFVAAFQLYELPERSLSKPIL